MESENAQDKNNMVIMAFEEYEKESSTQLSRGNLTMEVVVVILLVIVIAFLVFFIYKQIFRKVPMDEDVEKDQLNRER